MSDTPSDEHKPELTAERRVTDVILGRRQRPFEQGDLRCSAELQLDKMTTTELSNAQFMATGALDKLLHELRVHQIELEMQNQELRRAHIALEESRDQYLDLFDFAPVGYLILSETGLIADVNFTAATLLGVERKKLRSAPLSRYIAEDDADKYYLCLSHLVRQHEKQSLDIKIKKESGELRYLHLDARLVEPVKGEITLRVALTDITSQKQSEQELRIAATAFEVQDGIVVTDANLIIIRVNKSFTRITGYEESEIIGQHISIMNSGRHDSVFFHNIYEAINSNHSWQGEVWSKRKGGEVFPALTNVTSVFNENESVSHYVVSFLDITLQKRAEEVLLNDHKHLEKLIEKTVDDLNRLKEEGSEVNTALKVMIKLRESENSEAKSLLIVEIKQEIMPFLHRLKQSSHEVKQVRLLNVLEANLQRLIASYGAESSANNIYRNLTPKEIQVASMVRGGLSTKVIASTLSLSSETISIHRKNIRKKLGLDSKSNNLRSYLISLDKY